METISVRLDAEEAATLRRLARESGRSKSEVVRELIREHPVADGEKNGQLTAYDRIKHAIGKCRSGGGLNLSERTGDKFYAMLVEDRRKRDTRARRTASQTSARERSQRRR